MVTAATSSHPPRDRLDAFLTGYLGREELETISLHLTECAECCNTLRLAVPDDPLVRCVRQTQATPSNPELLAASQAAVKTLLSREKRHHSAAALPHPDSQTGSLCHLPHTVQQYQILAEVGRGGMGVVYKARDTQLQRDIALKMILSGQFASTEQIVRFRLEAELAARVRHPNVVQVYEIGEFQGQPFLALEWVDGDTLQHALQHRLAGPRLQPVAAAVLAETLARAVHAAHCQGVIHRDLKPSNVLLSGDVPKIADFGLARRLEEQRQLTVVGHLVGTPEYMSPEQANGQPQAQGPAVDIYALGAMLYEFLVGLPPFHGPTAIETIQQVIAQEPPAIRYSVPDCPADLETIAVKCLRKDPQQRYATAGDLADDLRRFLNHEPISARPSSPAERVWSWCRRNPLVASLLTALVVTFLGGVIASTTFAWAAHKHERNADSEAAAARQSERKARLASQEADEAKQNALARAYDANMLLAQSSWEQQSMPRFLKLLDQQRPRESENDLRSFEWYYWQRQLEARHVSLAPPKEMNGIARLEYDRSGSRLAISAAGGRVWMLDPQHPQQIRAISIHLGQVNCAAFSPDGTRLVSAGDDETVCLTDLDSGKPLWVSRVDKGAVTQINFDDSGGQLITSGVDGKIRFWDAHTGREESQWIFAGEGHVSFAIHSKANRFASSTPNGVLQIHELDTRREIAQTPAHIVRISHIEFSPDGQSVLTVGPHDRQVRMWDAATAAERFPALKHSQYVSHSAFDRTGTKLLTCGGDFILRTFDATTGRLLNAYSGHRCRVMGAAFNPVSTEIASVDCDGDVKIWSDQANPNPVVCRQTFSRPTQLAFLASQQAWVVPTDRQSIHWRSLRSGEILREMPCESCRSVAISPSQEYLLTANYERSIDLFDATTGTQIRRIATEADTMQLAVRPDSIQFVTADIDHKLRIRELPSGDLVRVLEGHTDLVQTVTYDPTGQRIASGSFDNNIILWDATTGRIVQTLKGHDHRVFSVAFSPDGKQLASASEDHTVKLWNPATGTALQTLRGHGGPVRCVAYSPDNKRFATGSWDQSIILWDTLTAIPILTLNGHTDEVAALQFSPTGEFLSSLSHDGTQRIWNAERNPPEDSSSR